MKVMVLKNRWLTAELDAQTGNLLRLRDGDGTVLVNHCWCSWSGAGQAISENPEVTAERVLVKDVHAVRDGVESVIGNGDVEILRRFTLPEDSPLLRVHYEIRPLRREVELVHPLALPEIILAEDFVDHFEDEQDLYFDGEELGDGRELPPWRVFFLQGHDRGLLAATRSKLEMSHFHISERSFVIKPHLTSAYSTDYIVARSPMKFDAGNANLHSSYQADFEIGPWRKEAHEEILRGAGLHAPSAHVNPPLNGEAMMIPKGIVFRGVDFAAAVAMSERFQPDKWLSVAMPHCLGGKALFAGCTVQSPPITLNPKLKGVYRVFVGIGNGNGIVAKFSADPLPTYRMPDGQADTMFPFQLRLSGKQQSQEMLLKTARMDGQSIEFKRMPTSYAATVLDYVRFERLSDQEAATWENLERREPVIELSGFNDLPDIAKLLNSADPDPTAFESNLWEHANCKVRKVYWRIDGQCSDYPSQVNTMRYVSAKVHALFTPHSKAYGRVLKKTDMLKLAVETARKYGLKLYGWQRFNSYMGNVKSEFFVNHPEYHEVYGNGHPASQLCLAHEPVRRHKIDILCEAAAYGLDGLNLGFLRHAPVLNYAPILVDGFRREYSIAPPPEPDPSQAEHVHSHPEEDPVRLNWYKYRAQWLTVFGRELRAALKRKGLEHVKISIWVNPAQCLYDGIDIDAWLEEGLCDEVVASISYLGRLADIPAEWRKKVQSRAKLIRGVSGFDINQARGAIAETLKLGYDGLCTYESNHSVVENSFIELYRQLRDPAIIHQVESGK